MTQVGEQRDAADADLLLAEAARIVRNERYCWLATTPKGGSIRLRPMGKVAFSTDAWTIQFITDGRSRKASDLRHANDVSVVCERQADDAYITLIGTAKLREHPSEVRERWKDAYDTYFPTESDKQNAVFIEISIDCIELWIRGLTPEPFGLHTTILQRGADGWRVTS
jgi:general stress protein 26